MVLAAPCWLLSVVLNITDIVVGLPVRFVSIYFLDDGALASPLGKLGRGIRAVKEFTWDARCLVCGRPALFAFVPLGILGAVLAVKLVRLSGAAMMLGTAALGLAGAWFAVSRFEKPVMDKAGRVADEVKEALMKAL